MSYQDNTLTCLDCRRFFAFSAEEQGLFRELGYDAPRRCRTCRRSLEDQRRYVGGDGHSRFPFGLSPVTASVARPLPT